MRKKVNLMYSALLVVCLSFFALALTKAVNAEENVIYFNDFNNTEATTFGDGDNAYSVTGGQIVSTQDFNTATLDLTGVTVPSNFVLSYDITYPNSVTGAFAGLNLRGMIGSDKNFEFTLEKTADAAYSFVKDPNGNVSIHSGNLGTNPVMGFETANHVVLAKNEEQFTLTVNGSVVYNYYIADALSPTSINLYTYAGGQTGIAFDNIKIVENTAAKSYTTQYVQDFEEVSSWGTFTVENGVAKSNQDFNTSENLPLLAAGTASFVLEYDVKYPEGANNAFVGVNMHGLLNPGQAIELTFQKNDHNPWDDFTLVKNNGAEYAHSNGAGGKQNPSVNYNEFIHISVVKIGSVIQFYVNDVLTLESIMDGTTSYEAFNFYTYAGGLTGIEIDNIVLREYNPDYREALWTEDFTEYTEDALLGSAADGFRVVAERDLAISETVFSTSGALTIPAEAFMENMTVEFDAYFPETVTDGYMGVYLGGIGEGEYEFTIQKTAGTDYALVKGPTGNTLVHSNDHASNPVLKYNELNHIAIQKYGSNFSIVVNGTQVCDIDVANAGNISSVRFYTYNAIDAGFTNISTYEYKAAVVVEGIQLSSDKTSLSTKQYATLTATLSPAGAKTLEYAWYVNDQLVEGERTKTYKFVPTAEGTYTVKVVAEGVTSNEVTLTVNAPSQEELNSIYYENFDSMANGSQYGSFVVEDGSIKSNSAYNNVFITDNFTAVESWEYAMDITFVNVGAGGAYAGLTVRHLDEAGSEVEFNLKKVLAGAVDGEGNPLKDQVIIKWAGAEKYYNDHELYGKNPEFGMELGQTYRLKVVKWQDQLEIYVNDVLQIKTYIPNASTVTEMFVYVYDGEGANIKFDNIVYKEASEITDLVLPPQVEVTSAYISTNKVIAEAGTEVTLTANCYPFNATPKTFQWYVNGQLIEGATEQEYVFKTDVAGEYVFKCVVDGDIESETKTITINAASSSEPTPEPTPEPSKKGCGGSVIASLFGVVALAGAAIVMRKKKEN